MNIDEADKLANKCVSVVLSCKNYKQLDNAIKYTVLTYKKLGKHRDLVNKVRFIAKIQLSIGFVKGYIKGRNNGTNSN